MTNGNEYANATWECDGQMREPGLTKREYFASLALQGLASISGYASINSPNVQEVDKILSQRAVQMADALITALNQHN